MGNLAYYLRIDHYYCYEADCNWGYDTNSIWTVETCIKNNQQLAVLPRIHMRIAYSKILGHQVTLPIDRCGGPRAVWAALLAPPSNS